MSGNEAWLTTDKNRYCPGESIVATVHIEGTITGTNISAMLTGHDRKTVTLEPCQIECNVCYFNINADVSGAYSLICVIENNIEIQYICSTCFFVGDCEAAIPKVPDVPLLFVPEIWEEPNYYKLISLYLRNDGKPVPNVHVTLIFRNKSGRLRKELRTDGTGNVFFAPYMAGTYCLAGQMSLRGCNGVCVDITTSFSITIAESDGKRSRVTKNKYRI